MCDDPVVTAANMLSYMCIMTAVIHICLSVDEDVEEHVVTKTTRIVKKSAPGEGSVLVLVPTFLPRDAMLARYLLWRCVRLSVCLSVVYVHHKSVFCQNGLDSDKYIYTAWSLKTSHFVSAVDKISADAARRAVRLMKRLSHM